jgi:hypothetical protein
MSIVPALRLVGLWLTCPPMTASRGPAAAPHDLARLRASIVRLPDSRPRSGRTPDIFTPAGG